MDGYLGIDVGSISTNLVVIEPMGEVMASLYLRGEGSPIRSVLAGLDQLRQTLDSGVRIAGVCTTGSGGKLLRMIVGADLFKNEITSHARAAIHFHPDVHTIFEIGGQDSKVAIVRDRVVVDFSMNLICAAGTGSFLDSQAKRLNMSIEELSARAMLSTNPTTIAGRCTVFAESDMIHKQQAGHAQEDILMGLCHALVRNFLSNVCRGKEMKPPIVFQGGVSANSAIIRAFKEVMEEDVIIPRHHMVMGAYGAALIAAKAGLKSTRFRGFGITEHAINTRSFECEDCANHCDILEIIDGCQVIGMSGGRCRKWERVVQEEKIAALK